MNRITMAARGVVKARYGETDSWDILKDAIAALADALEAPDALEQPAQAFDGGPAFPLHLHMQGAEGMSLRDFFAAAALQSLAAATMEDTLKRGRDANKAKEQLCHGCFAIADEMIAARERKEDA